MTITDEAIDVTTLLEPIQSAPPCGVNLRDEPGYDSLYRKIKTARDDARSAEKARTQGWDRARDADAPPDPADHWQTVLDLGCQALRDHSKDYQICAWLIEALLRLKGFPGLRDGLRLARELTERFWDEMYPRPDENDSDGPLEGRLTWMGRVADATILPRGMLTQLFEKEKRSDHLEHGVITPRLYPWADELDSENGLRAVATAIEESLKEVNALDQTLAERCSATDGSESPAPSWSQLCEVLEDLLRGPLAEHRAAAGAADAGSPNGQDEAASPGRLVEASPREPMTREQAIRQLQQIASFFEKTERQSPVPYVIRQAVRWTDKPLPELMSELLSAKIDSPEAAFRFIGLMLAEQDQREE